MPYNYAKLNGAITEYFGSQIRFAQEMALSERSVSLKVNGKIGWKQKEIAKACELLRISTSEIGTYFFTI